MKSSVVVELKITILMKELNFINFNLNNKIPLNNFQIQLMCFTMFSLVWCWLWNSKHFIAWFCFHPSLWWYANAEVLKSLISSVGVAFFWWMLGFHRHFYGWLKKCRKTWIYEPWKSIKNFSPWGIASLFPLSEHDRHPKNTRKILQIHSIWQNL